MSRPRPTLLRILLPVLAAGSLAVAERTGESLRDSLVEVQVTHQEYDPQQPWQKRPPGSRAGHAICIDDGLLLTTEDLVRNHTLIELRKAGSGLKITARLLVADEQVNLALLAPTQDLPTAFGALVPVPVSDALPAATEHRVAQFDATDALWTGGATRIRVAGATLPNAPYEVLAFHLLTEQHVERRAAPVFSGDALSGLVLTHAAATRIAVVLAYPVIRRFLDDALAPPYAGVATAGVLWRPLLDPVKRRWLALEETTDDGVLVVGAVPGSGGDGRLLPMDVVLAWDGRAVSSQGFYTDPTFGRLSFGHAIRGLRRPGHIATATVWRAAARLEVEVPLARATESASDVPENNIGAPAAYLIEGGCVLRELTGDFLKSHGSDWWARVDPRLAQAYFRANAAESPGTGRVVFVAMVLPDPINVGYQDIRHARVEAVNGRPIRRLEDVFNARAEDGVIHRIRLQGEAVELVLDRESIPEANARIARAYDLHALQRRAPPD